MVVNINEKAHEGWILSRVLFEVVGHPKEHVEESLKKYLEELRKTSNIHIVKEDFAEAEKRDQFWACFSELEILTKDVPTLVGLCLDYMPASVEILEPEVLSLKNNVLTGWINDILNRIHDVDMIVKNVNAENKLLRKNASGLFKNLVIVSLDQSPKSVDDLGKHIGVPSVQLQDLLGPLEKDGIIEKDGDKYRIVKK